MDVWSWTAPKYRFRSILLLLLNLALYGGLCIFTYYLRVGRAFEFTWASYFEPARFWGSDTQNLYDFIMYPISVEQNPLHGVVVGLLLASIVSIPIATAITYRFPFAIPFCACVLVFGHLPWLALTLLCSCLVASVRPFRLRFTYGAALVGMLPVLLYIFLATRGATDLLSTSISPERKLLLAGPWLLAILGACVMLAVILFIAQAVNYRPGAISPVMAIMFAAPLALFQQFVGFDELAYRTLELEFGPRAKRFEPVQDAADTIATFFMERMDRGADRDMQRAVVVALWNAQPNEQAAIKRRVWNHLLLRLLEDRQRAYEACKEFLETYLESRFIPNVLYIQARVMDTRLDELRLMADAARRELYTDFPHAQSEAAWTALLTQYPASPLAVAAKLRTAQLRLRRGDIAGALSILEIHLPRARGASELRRAALEEALPEETLEFEPDEFLFQIERLRELILENGWVEGAPRDRAALRKLMSLDTHRAGYREQLARLAEEYADRPVADNLIVLWAAAEPDRAARAALLAEAVKRFETGDARAEALFYLADLEVQRFGVDGTRRAQGIERLQALADHYGGTCWGRLAAKRLEMLRPSASGPAAGSTP